MSNPSNPPKVVRTPTIGFTYSLANANLKEVNTFVEFVEDGQDANAIQNKDEPVGVNFSGDIDALRTSILAQQSSIKTLIYKNEEAIVKRLRKEENISTNYIELFEFSNAWSNYVNGINGINGLVLDSLHASLADGDLIRFSITLETDDVTNPNEVTLVYYCKNVLPTAASQ